MDNSQVGSPDGVRFAMLFDEDASHAVVPRLLLLRRTANSSGPEGVLLRADSNSITRVGSLQECTQLGPLADIFQKPSVDISLTILVNGQPADALQTIEAASSCCALTAPAAGGTEYSVTLPNPVEADRFFVYVYRRSDGSIGSYLHTGQADGEGPSEQVTLVEVFIADDSIPEEKRYFRLVLVKQLLISVEGPAGPGRGSVDGAALLREHGHTPSRLFVFKRLDARVSWDDSFLPEESEEEDVSVSIVRSQQSEEEEDESIEIESSTSSCTVSLVLPPDPSEESPYSEREDGSYMSITIVSSPNDEESYFTARSEASNATEPPSVVGGYEASGSKVVFTASMLVDGFDSDFIGSESIVVAPSGLPVEEGELEVEQQHPPLRAASSQSLAPDEATPVIAPPSPPCEDDLGDIYEDTDDAAHDIDLVMSVADNASLADNSESLFQEALKKQTEALRANVSEPSTKLDMYVAHKNKPLRASSAVKTRRSPPQAKRVRPKTAVSKSKPPEKVEPPVKRMPMSATQMRRRSASKPVPEPEPLPKRPRVPKQVPRARSPPKAKPKPKEINTEVYSMFVAACGGRSGETATKDYTRCLSPITRSILERTSRPSWEPEAPPGGSQLLKHRPDTSPSKRPSAFPHTEMVLSSGDYAGIRDKRIQSANASLRRTREAFNKTKDPSAADFLPLVNDSRPESVTPSRHGLTYRGTEEQIVNSNMLTIVHAGTGVSTPFALPSHQPHSYRKTIVTNTLNRPKSAVGQSSGSINKKLRLSPCPVNAIWYRQVHLPPGAAGGVAHTNVNSKRPPRPLSSAKRSQSPGKKTSPPVTDVWKSTTLTITGVLKSSVRGTDEIALAPSDDSCERKGDGNRNYVAKDLAGGPCRDVFHGHYDVGLSVTFDYAQLVDMNGTDSGSSGTARKTWLVAHGAAAAGLDSDASTVCGPQEVASAQPETALLAAVDATPPLSPRNLQQSFLTQSGHDASLSLLANTHMTNVFGEKCTNTVTLVSEGYSNEVIERPHLRCGDEVISIDGWDIGRMNVAQIRELVNDTDTEARTVTLTVRRYIKGPVDDPQVSSSEAQVGPDALVNSSLLLINREALPFDDITLSRAEIIKKKQDKEKSERLGKIPVLHTLINVDELPKQPKPASLSQVGMVRSMSAKARLSSQTGAATPGDNKCGVLLGSQTADRNPSKRRDKLIDFALSRQLIRPNSAVAMVSSPGDVTPEGSMFFGATGSKMVAKSGLKRGASARKKLTKIDHREAAGGPRLGAFVPSTKPASMPFGFNQVESVLHNILEEKWTQTFGIETPQPQTEDTADRGAGTVLLPGVESEVPRQARQKKGRAFEVLAPKTRGGLMVDFEAIVRRGQNKVRKLLIQSMDENSRIFEQGIIRIGDEVVEINGLPVAGKFYEDILRDIRRDRDDHVLLTVHRQDVDEEEGRVMDQRGASFVVKTRELVSQHSWGRLLHDV